MLLHELDKPNPLLVKLVAVTSQLVSQIENGEVKADWTVDELLDYLKDNEIILDKSDLYDMIKRPPLKNKIKNIQADNVIFKGQTETPQSTEDESQKVVQQMAKSAMK
jgi:hypothetical protein